MQVCISSVTSLKSDVLPFMTTMRKKSSIVIDDELNRVQVSRSATNSKAMISSTPFLKEMKFELSKPPPGTKIQFQRSVTTFHPPLKKIKRQFQPKNIAYALGP